MGALGIAEILIAKALHYVGFAGCLVASSWKNRLLRAERIEGVPLQRLAMLDRVSGLSALIILLSGLSLALWVGRPSQAYSVTPLFWAKVALYTAASLAVLMTKPILRRALGRGWLVPRLWMQAMLLFDLSAIIVVALLGWILARGGVL